MGIIIYTSFSTPEGFGVTSVYSRISQVTYTAISKSIYRITMKLEFYLNYEKRLNECRPLSVPDISDLMSFDGEFKGMSDLYPFIKSQITSKGLTVEDVFEPSTTEPAPEASTSQQSSE